jgi:hypothetical protein
MFGMDEDRLRLLNGTLMDVAPAIRNKGVRNRLLEEW